MATTPVTISQFGGLDRREPFSVGATGATDLLNVNLSQDGYRLRTREGYAKFNSTTIGTNSYDMVYGAPTNNGELLATRTELGPATIFVDKIGPTGTTTNVGSFVVTSSSTGGYSFASIGTATSTLVYFTSGNSTSNETLRKYDGAALAASSGKPMHVAATPWDGRLAQASYFNAADTPSAANGSLSTVFFSDVGAPDTYTSTSWVQLQPGNGEAITGMVAWRELLFVFKQTMAYVFYGTSTLSDGTPVFNYRRLSLPSIIPFDPATGRNRFVVAGQDGVYYSTPNGIFVTTGDVSQLVSGALTPLFTSDSAVTQRIFAGGQASPALAWAAGKLIVSYVENAGLRQFVLDPATGFWSRWNLPAVSVYSNYGVGKTTTIPEGGAREAIYFPLNANIYATGPANTTDNGTAISWSYTSGKYPLDEEQRVVVTRESSLFGTGTVTLTLSSDRYADQSGSVTLGTAPTPAEGWLQKDQEGRFFQHAFSGSGSATIETLTHNVATVKPAGIA